MNKHITPKYTRLKCSLLINPCHAEFIFRKLNSLAPGRYGSNFKTIILKLLIQKSSFVTRSEIALGWMTQNLNGEKSSEHWFREWLGAYRQQAITWANAGPCLCGHMASLVHTELKIKGRLGPSHVTLSLSWLLMAWRHKEPGHQ